jgi:hypothetical protein
MRCDLLLLAAVPSTLASVFAYNPSSTALAQAKTNSSCDLPSGFAVRNFVGNTNGTNGTLANYKFNYVDLTTNLTTVCEHKPSSAPVQAANGSSPVYPCANKNVEYSWDGAKSKLSLFEHVCPGADGYVNPKITECKLLAN